MSITFDGHRTSATNTTIGLLLAGWCFTLIQKLNSCIDRSVLIVCDSVKGPLISESWICKRLQTIVEFNGIVLIAHRL